LLSQVTDAVASLNSSTAGAVQSLTGAVARYNAAALALEATGGFVNATERLEDALTAATNHGLEDLQSVLNTTDATAAVIAQGGMAALTGASAAASQGLQVIRASHVIAIACAHSIMLYSGYLIQVLMLNC
jgi:1-deoxy-D-xylulose 5-phosphate reductoisomerase